jgi:hypothetical protein
LNEIQQKKNIDLSLVTSIKWFIIYKTSRDSFIIDLFEAYTSALIFELFKERTTLVGHSIFRSLIENDKQTLPVSGSWIFDSYGLTATKISKYKGRINSFGCDLICTDNKKKGVINFFDCDIEVGVRA